MIPKEIRMFLSGAACLSFFILVAFAFIVLLLTACTYSVIQTQAEGSAKDVVDQVQEASPNIAPNIAPVSPLGCGECEEELYEEEDNTHEPWIARGHMSSKTIFLMKKKKTLEQEHEEPTS